jgi:hypothetical protein
MVSRGIKSRESEMTIQLDEENGGKVLAVRVSGKLAKADYERFVPAFERLLRKAAWFAMHHFDDIERIAMVGKRGGNMAWGRSAKWRRSANHSRKRQSDMSIASTPLRRRHGWTTRNSDL